LTQLALRATGEPLLRDYLQNIRASGKHLLAIVNDILDFSKIEAHRMELESIPFRVADVVGQVVGQLGPEAEAKGLDFQLKMADGLPAELMGDPLRLGQVLLNLVANAVKFTTQGRVGIEVRPLPGEGRRGLVEFSVSDTGIGIAPEHQATLFDAFVQGDGSISRKHGGTGLGLAISLRLVRLMGGDIRLDSELGRGSRFCFAVPFEPAAAPAEVAESLLAGDEAPSRLAGARILVVEDNALNRLVARDFLERLGAVVELAVDGEEAVAKVESGQYDAVLMDIHMPQLSGYETTERIRRRHPKESLPIIAMTADVFADTVEHCLAVGMNAHVAKPLDIDRLPVELLRWIPPRAAESSGSRPAPPPDSGGLAGLDGIPGLEAGAALRRMGLTSQVYLAHLGEFVDHHGDVPARLRQLLQAHMIEELGFLAHRVRGQAATLGLVRIERAAGELEAVTRQGPDVRLDASTRELMAALDDACRHVGANLAGLGRRDGRAH
jgi:CheY-like chemotaxis protein